MTRALPETQSIQNLDRALRHGITDRRLIPARTRPPRPCPSQYTSRSPRSARAARQHSSFLTRSISDTRRSPCPSSDPTHSGPSQPVAHLCSVEKGQNHHQYPILAFPRPRTRMDSSNGWPRAIAPPFTFTFATSRPSSFTQYTYCDANASLIWWQPISDPCTHPRCCCTDADKD